MNDFFLVGDTLANSGLHILSWEKFSQFVNLDSKLTYCVVAPPQSPMAPQNSILYPWPPSISRGPQGGHLAPGWEPL